MQFCFHVQSANGQQNDTKNTTTNMQMKKKKRTVWPRSELAVWKERNSSEFVVCAILLTWFLIKCEIRTRERSGQKNATLFQTIKITSSINRFRKESLCWHSFDHSPNQTNQTHHNNLDQNEFEPKIKMFLQISKNQWFGRTCVKLWILLVLICFYLGKIQPKFSWHNQLRYF